MPSLFGARDRPRSLGARRERPEEDREIPDAAVGPELHVVYDLNVLAADPRRCHKEAAAFIAQFVGVVKVFEDIEDYAQQAADLLSAFGGELLGQRRVEHGISRERIGDRQKVACLHRFTQQQEEISGKIVATYQLLLEEMILLCGERTGQTLWCTRNILASYQVGKFSKLVCPSQLVQDGETSLRLYRAQRRYDLPALWVSWTAKAFRGEHRPDAETPQDHHPLRTECSLSLVTAFSYHHP